MNSLLKELGISVKATVALAFIVCGIYPVIVWLLAQGVFPYQANGSLVVVDGTKRGSLLIAQGFTGEKYFHPRPSAAGDGYDAANSGGSNLGPLSKQLVQTVSERVAGYRQENGLSEKTPIPADAVTASASGLDPHISSVNAEIQARRVAKARGMKEQAVLKLVGQETEGRDLGVFGEPRVNVLRLNMALDAGR